MDRKPNNTRNTEDFPTNSQGATDPSFTFWGWVSDFFPNLRDAGIRWAEDDAGSLAASVAYYLALSLFPLMLLLTSGIGLFFEFSNFGRDAEAQILDAVEQQTTPMVKDQIGEVLNQLRNQSIVSGPTGIVAAILAAIGVFAQIDRGFDRIFRIPLRKSLNMRGTILKILRHRFLAFLMMVSLGGTILVLFASTMVLSQIQSITGSTYPSLAHIFGLFETLATLSINGLLFGTVYKFLPKKKVAWSDAIRGGLLVAIIWELGRTLLGAFFIGMRYTSAYGVIGSFIAILLWCYYGISILFFGAEYVQVLEQRRASRLNPTQGIEYHGSESSESGNAAGMMDQKRQASVADDSSSLHDPTNPVLLSTSVSEAGRQFPFQTGDDDRQQPRRSSN